MRLFCFNYHALVVLFIYMQKENMPLNEPGGAAAAAETPAAPEKSAPPPRRSASPRQLAANRRNARKSTGPATPQGRAISRMNALKHAILSREALVRGLHIRESAQELRDLHQRFLLELNPVGPVEEMLVDQIVTAHWRWRRALKAESGEIALSVDGGRWERRPSLDDELRRVMMLPSPVSGLEESSTGLSLLACLLGRLRDLVQLEGELTPSAIRQLKDSLGGHPNPLTRSLDELRLRLQDNPERLQPEALRERNQSRALRFLEEKLERLASQKEDCAKREAIEEESRQAASALPAMPVLQKIIGYETRLERQLYRAMTQLERLQRLRRGEAVPPPLKLEVAA
jgi:hypothetical protein